MNSSDHKAPSRAPVADGPIEIRRKGAQALTNSSVRTS
jgi:hypothetical protein